MGDALAARLVAIARSSAPLVQALEVARALGLPQGCIGAGAVRNLVWDRLHGRPGDAAADEIDLVYFDPDGSLAQQRACQVALAAAHPRWRWDVKNQALVHLWYGERFGQAVAPFATLAEGIASWPEFATCVALRMGADGALQVVAPHGLQDLFGLELRHNPVRAPLHVARERMAAKRWLDRWPRLRPVGALAPPPQAGAGGGGQSLDDRCVAHWTSQGRWRPARTEAVVQIDGSCHCGAVQFTALVDPARVMVCHCSDCQVLSGAPFRAVVAARCDSLQVQGETRAYVKVADSGNRRAQVFCPTCATPLWATAPENPTAVVIRLGCVRQRAQLRPSVQIWQHSALPWVNELPSIPGSPAQQAFLPAP